MALLTIEGVALKEPSSYDLTYKDLDSENSYTSETGYLNRDIIRVNQRNIAVSWDSLSSSELKTILNAINLGSSATSEKSSKNFLSISYFDYMTMTQRTGTFYPDDRGAKGKLVRAKNGRFSISFNFIER